MEDSVFGRYRIESELDSGGMAEVFLAKHELTERAAAIKILNKTMSASDEIVKRFFQEAQAAARIQHPGIVDVFDVGYTPRGRAYIAMELLTGENLSIRLKREKRLSLKASVLLMRQVADAMAAAHHAGIIHRDLKPSNLYIVEAAEMDGGERVKVLDFGLAKLTENAAVKTALSAVFGTPSYMSPEQCRSSASVDARADLYAIGCLFYVCLCGRPPFGTGHQVEILAAHMARPVTPPVNLRADIPPDLNQIVLDLLEKDPDRRVQSCEALMARLDQVVFQSSGTLVGGAAPVKAAPLPGVGVISKDSPAAHARVRAAEEEEEEEIEELSDIEELSGIEELAEIEELADFEEIGDTDPVAAADDGAPFDHGYRGRAASQPGDVVGDAAGGEHQVLVARGPERSTLKIPSREPALPGVAKTTAMVRLAEEDAAAGRRDDTDKVQRSSLSGQNARADRDLTRKMPISDVTALLGRRGQGAGAADEPSPSAERDAVEATEGAQREAVSGPDDERVDTFRMPISEPTQALPRHGDVQPRVGAVAAGRAATGSPRPAGPSPLATPAGAWQVPPELRAEMTPVPGPAMAPAPQRALAPVMIEAPQRAQTQGSQSSISLHGVELTQPPRARQRARFGVIAAVAVGLLAMTIWAFVDQRDEAVAHGDSAADEGDGAERDETTADKAAEDGSTGDGVSRAGEDSPRAAREPVDGVHEEASVNSAEEAARERVDALLERAEAALEGREWREALDRLREADDIEGVDDARSARLELLTRRAQDELLNQLAFERLANFDSVDDIDKVIAEYAKITADSSYRAEADKLYQAARARWLESIDKRVKKLSSRGSCSEIAPLVQQAEERFPDEVGALANRTAECESRKVRRDEGNRAAASTEDVEAEVNRLMKAANAAQQQGDNNKALMQCRKAWRLAPQKARVTAFCGIVACRANADATARRYYQQSTNTQHRAHIAQICLRNGINVQRP